MLLNGQPPTVDQISRLALVNLGHFTSMRVEDGGVRGLSLHLERLARDCRQVFATELDLDRVRQYLRSAAADASGPIVMRATVYDPRLELGKPGAAADPNVLVTTTSAAPVPMPPLRLQTAVFTRELARVKHIGLFGAVHHRAAAQRNGYDDVLFTAADGTVSEAATANIGFIDADNRIIWPKADVLAGTTMRLLCQARDEEVLTKHIALSDLPQYRAAILTNVAIGVRAVHSVDETTWSTDHPMIAELRADYESIPTERL
ncbi:aminotransferase class IV family protein [Nocardia salmonicida]|uniref:aminotransferase class IV family protein n=1 Tax=Nocardia salmonicida TaxID=53431 RepID=UPI0007A4F133|nr:aminotransferase class IV family protein [Nocardia salmonicida]MBC7299795.1 aminotransferase class IV family protein [Nocardia sp.]